MKFSVFTASTPEWSPAEVASHLAEQGWHGVEWRITDQEEAAVPGFWAGNRATFPLTGLEDLVPTIARLTNDAGLEFSASVATSAATTAPMWIACWRRRPHSGQHGYA